MITPTVRQGNLYYLPVKGKETNMEDILVIQLHHQFKAINTVRGDGRRWALVEWACEADSLLSRWFQQRGLKAMRLGLPDHDLSKKAEAVRVADD
eukprot:7808942-Heterocapsa_arctica.AAC.1